MTTFTYVAQLTEDNLDDIVKYGAQHNLNLDDFREAMEDDAQWGENTYAIASIDMDTEELIHITTKDEKTTFASWCLHPSDTYLYFTRATSR